MTRSITIREIAERTGGVVLGEADRVITGVGSLEGAGPGDLVYVDGPQYASALAASRASAVLLPEGVDPPPGMSGVRVRRPGLAMALAIEALYPRERAFRDVSPAAFLGKEVVLEEDVGIGPGAWVGDGARIGRGTEIHPLATVGRGCTVGADCILYPGAHIYERVTIGNRVIIHSGVVLGADGFGFVQEKFRDEDGEENVRHHKVPQVGTVVIEDDVEIGANTTIDRSALEETRIGRGTKIDNLVMVGHNCRVGPHSIIVSQAGISGSTVLDHHVTIAGQAGIVGHVKIGARAIVAAQAGVMRDVPEGQVVIGAPAMDAKQGKKALALIESLPEFKKAIADHEKRIGRLEGPPDRA